MIRVAHIIDSLNAGGAERIAVNYANGLTQKKIDSSLIVTREEGALKAQILPNTPYLFLQKTKTIDLKAVLKLRRFILENKITIIHAHGSSFFLVFLVKMICWRLKLIYHEHNGERIKQTFLHNLPLLICLLFFSKIIVVNKQLIQWYKKMGYSNVNYFPNFADLEYNSNEKTTLFGENNKRIVCLANLRNPKNHGLLIESFAKILPKYPDWSLHLIGKNYGDSYSRELLKKIKLLNIEKEVFIYGAKNDIGNILQQASLGVLCSTFEGFPVTLLEYGMAELPVICSDVGYCSEIIIPQKTGLLFPSNEESILVKQLAFLIAEENERNKYSIALRKHVLNNFSRDKVVHQLIELYMQIDE